MKPKVGDIYVHFKSPDKQYEIIGFGFHTETEEEMVVYKPLYDLEVIRGTDMEYCVRPISKFLSPAVVDGKEVERFVKVL